MEDPVKDNETCSAVVSNRCGHRHGGMSLETVTHQRHRHVKVLSSPLECPCHPHLTQTGCWNETEELMSSCALIQMLSPDLRVMIQRRSRRDTRPLVFCPVVCRDVQAFFAWWHKQLFLNASVHPTCLWTMSDITVSLMAWQVFQFPLLCVCVCVSMATCPCSFVLSSPRVWPDYAL